MTVEDYTGRRILEAMHEAVRYTRAVSGLIEKAWPADAIQVLEFGAGDGAFVKQFRAAGANVDCVEIDRTLRVGLQTLGGRVYGDIREAASESYDFIYSVNVLEHIPDLVREVAELKRVLRPGGVLFVFVPAFRLLWTSLDTEVGHVTRFTRGSLATALKEGGFQVSSMAYFDSLGFPAAIAVGFLEKLNLFSYGGGTVGFYDSYIFPVSRALDIGLQHVLGKNLVAVARNG
jgi:SAM-dependent methyltransferase